MGIRMLQDFVVLNSPVSRASRRDVQSRREQGSSRRHLDFGERLPRPQRDPNEVSVLRVQRGRAAPSTGHLA